MSQPYDGNQPSEPQPQYFRTPDYMANGSGQLPQGQGPGSPKKTNNAKGFIIVGVVIALALGTAVAIRGTGKGPGPGPKPVPTFTRTSPTPTFTKTAPQPTYSPTTRTTTTGELPAYACKIPYDSMWVYGGDEVGFVTLRNEWKKDGDGYTDGAGSRMRMGKTNYKTVQEAGDFFKKEMEKTGSYVTRLDTSVGCLDKSDKFKAAEITVYDKSKMYTFIVVESSKGVSVFQLEGEVSAIAKTMTDVKFSYIGPN